MRDGTNLNRRADLRAALKRAKPGDLLSLEECAILWGVVKTRFVNVRNLMADFPQPIPADRNRFNYPAIEAIKAMLAHETRNDSVARQRAARADVILGKATKRSASAPIVLHTPNELATLSRMAAETEQRERDQGLYVPVADNAALANEIFSEISEFHRELSNKMDPHGLLSPEQRTLIDSLGTDFLLRLHRKMKDVLSPDAKPRGNRATSRRVRKSPARR